MAIIQVKAPIAIVATLQVAVLQILVFIVLVPACSGSSCNPLQAEDVPSHATSPEENRKSLTHS
jgi:hypothetical protein